MNEVLLTIDTSTQVGSVALSRGEVLLGENLLNGPRTQTDSVLVSIGRLLEDAGLGIGDVDGLGVVLGPGSFTGVRVGVASVKGLALATGKPVFGVSSLRALALQAPAARHPVCALLDARKKEVYAGVYGWERGLPAPLGPEAVLPPEKLLSALEGEVLFLGDGATVYRTLIARQMGDRAHFAPWPLHAPRASNAAVLALLEMREGRSVPLEFLTPSYIRLSEAEITWARRRAEGVIDG
ncbi:MAG: tRNA (adenosine(37)-N6)-threonylcarbamoyltransferase complex dimerization subunit type 1 TsaB [Desulfuromonas sp.]|uniref:tRNA (adenosine(37)-N6)-threonylcarbamoyltransferase complex dimerization subunit type 1 TsaB n=1 Tax=Desulfuromonas sp. TaxID=892 RepID=UPI000CAEC7F2|nr:tRNA (adenosine(37)-N6)-threonylcarbamoyltransferase complex dimerization subunit type 1 TsaB [Desulfuromonas sp.]PLX85094.1 MAG: tRNA (adenosine(37)-N6)-threonylcarbamoyltransferase complex dimerization subunit type 1 TsaB [Desulfuromonas sp.]